MNFIKLTRGKFTKVDDWWFEELNRYKWFAHKMRNTYYAARNVKINGKYTIVFMHRVIMNTPKEFKTDHKNHETLDNQEHNLRICTPQQNGMNKTASGKLKSLGVSIKKERHFDPFAAQIQFNGKTIHLGYFHTEREAAKAYDKKAKELFGEFANPNFK
jgi:hypothetical protein